MLNTGCNDLEISKSLMREEILPELSQRDSQYDLDRKKYM
jgi:hypothetical protein